MKNSTKQVVILDSLSSPYIAQAILFLKDGCVAQEEKVLAEAEKIVAEYFRRPQPAPAPQQKAAAIPWVISGFSVLLAAVSYFFF